MTPLFDQPCDGFSHCKNLATSCYQSGYFCDACRAAYDALPEVQAGEAASLTRAISWLNSNLPYPDGPRKFGEPAKPREDVLCPRCRSVMSIRLGKYGEFWACPALLCSGTRSVKSVPPEDPG